MTATLSSRGKPAGSGRPAGRAGRTARAAAACCGRRRARCRSACRVATAAQGGRDARRRGVGRLGAGERVPPGSAGTRPRRRGRARRACGPRRSRTRPRAGRRFDLETGTPAAARPVRPSPERPAYRRADDRVDARARHPPGESSRLPRPGGCEVDVTARPRSGSPRATRSPRGGSSRSGHRDAPLSPRAVKTSGLAQFSGGSPRRKRSASAATIRHARSRHLPARPRQVRGHHHVRQRGAAGVRRAAARRRTRRVPRRRGARRPGRRRARRGRRAPRVRS